MSNILSPIELLGAATRPADTVYTGTLQALPATPSPQYRVAMSLAVHLSVNPATEDIDMDIRGAPSSSAADALLLTVNNAAANWIGPNDAGNYVAIFTTLLWQPWVRVQINVVTASTTQTIAASLMHA